MHAQVSAVLDLAERRYASAAANAASAAAADSPSVPGKWSGGRTAGDCLEGMIQLLHGDANAGAAALALVAQADPPSALAPEALAHSRVRRKEWSEARTLYEAAIPARPCMRTRATADG